MNQLINWELIHFSVLPKRWRILITKNGMDQVVTIIHSGRGSAFDPEVVDVFLEFEDDFWRIALEFVDFEETVLGYTEWYQMSNK